MTARPRNLGFDGFDGFDDRPVFASALEVNPRWDPVGFEQHFHGEGLRHADEVAAQLLRAQVLSGEPDLFDSAAVTSFGPADSLARQRYATGLCAGLAFNGDVLRGQVALQDLHLDPNYTYATADAAPLRRADRLAVADKLSALGTTLSQQAGIRLPQRLATANAADHAAAPDVATAPANAGQRQSAPTPARPGTAAARHTSTPFAGRRDGRGQ